MSEVSLREYLERLLAEQDRRIEQAQASSRVAIEKAEYAVDKRLDLLNEFRAQSADESINYVRTNQWDGLVERIKALEASRDRAYGGILIVAIIGVANLVKLFW